MINNQLSLPHRTTNNNTSNQKPALTRVQSPCRQCIRLSLDLKINGFPGFIGEGFRVKLGDPSCIRFWDIMLNTDRQTELLTLPPATAVGLGNNKELEIIKRITQKIRSKSSLWRQRVEGTICETDGFYYFLWSLWFLLQEREPQIVKSTPKKLKTNFRIRIILLVISCTPMVTEYCLPMFSNSQKCKASYSTDV